MFDKEVFADRLKGLREKTGLNQKECAEKLNISRGSISFYENGERIPDIETIYNMATFFNVSADYLVGLTDLETTNTNIRDVCEFLELSEETIYSLHYDSSADSSMPFEDMFLTISIVGEKPIYEIYHNYIVEFKNKFLSSTAYKKMLSSSAYALTNAEILFSLPYASEEELNLIASNNKTFNKIVNIENEYKFSKYEVFEAQTRINEFITSHILDMSNDTLKAIEEKIEKLRSIKLCQQLKSGGADIG